MECGRTVRIFITLGILIALGLEQIVAAHHRAKLAAEAVAGFRHELADNRANVQGAMVAMPKLRAEIQAQIAQVSLPPPAGSAAPPIKYPSIYFESISTASWDTAVATHALNEIPYEKARRYVEAYDVLRVFFEQERTGLAAWQDMRVFGNDSVRLTPDERRALIEQLHRYESFTYVIDMMGRAAIQACDRALQ